MRIMKFANSSAHEEILLGNSFTRAKNLYTSLDPVVQRSAMRTLNVERNRLWCLLTLYILIYCLAWRSFPSEGDLRSPISVFFAVFGMFFIPIFGIVNIALTILSIFVTLRVKHLSVLSNDEVGNVSDVQK